MPIPKPPVTERASSGGAFSFFTLSGPTTFTPAAAKPKSALDSDPPKPSRPAARKHLAQALEQAERDVAYHQGKVEEEESRVARDNAHLRALIASFG